MRLAIALLVAPAVAVADPSLELKDRGDAVEVIAHNIKAVRTNISPVRSRLEVAVGGFPIAKPIAPATDATVKVIELDGGNLSVKLNYERPTVAALARFAQATQVGDDLHLIFPRKLPAEGTTVVLPEPTLPPELAAKLESPPKPAAKPEPKPAAKPEPKLEQAEPRPEAPAAAPKKPTAIATAPDDDTWSKVSMYAALGLAALGGGAWILKKRRTQAAPTSTIEIIAQRSLAGKAKVVWLAAGTREMVVAVTAQNVRVLGQWKRGDAGPTHAPQLPLPEAQAMPAMPRTLTSPAVNGILKLRAQTQQNINADVATDDVEADAQWTREILAATGGRR